MNIAVILAGGVGTRVGAEVPKQFIKVLGKPILAYTIEVFQNHPKIDAVEVVCLPTHIEEVVNIKKDYGLTKVEWITEAGADFQESVMNGIMNLENRISHEDIVLIHFGVSPFVEENIITDAIEVCRKKGNAISTTDFYISSGIKDKTVSTMDETNSSSQYICRDTIACMNAPYAFKYGFILDVYKEAVKTGVIEEIEPYTITLLYKMGKTIYFSLGSQTNIKITRKEDVDLFEGYVLMKQRRYGKDN